MSDEDEDEENFDDEIGQKNRNPSPAEIREACAAFQATWTDAQRIGRMRSDWRPEYPEMLGGGSPMSRPEAVRHVRGVRANEKHLDRLRDPQPEKLPPVWLLAQMDIEFADDDGFEEFDEGDDEADEDLDSESEVSELSPLQPAAEQDDDDEPDEPQADEPPAVQKTQEQADAETLKRLQDEHHEAQQAFSKAYRSATALLRAAGFVKPGDGEPARGSFLHEHLARDDSIAPLNQRVQAAWKALKEFRDLRQQQTTNEPDESEMFSED